MSITYQRPEINSFKDLANNPNYQATIQKGSIGEIDILVCYHICFTSFSLIYSILNPQKAETGDLKLVGDKLRQCSTCSGTDFDGLARKVLEEKNYVSILVSVLISFSNL